MVRARVSRMGSLVWVGLLSLGVAACGGGGSGRSGEPTVGVRGVAIDAASQPVAAATVEARVLTAGALFDDGLGVELHRTITGADGAFGLAIPLSEVSGAYGGTFYRLSVTLRGEGEEQPLPELQADAYVEPAGLDIGLVKLWQPKLTVNDLGSALQVRWPDLMATHVRGADGYHVRLWDAAGRPVHEALLSGTSTTWTAQLSDLSTLPHKVTVTALTTQATASGPAHIGLTVSANLAF